MQSDLSLLTNLQLWQNENQKYQILLAALNKKLGDWILQQDKKEHSLDVSNQEIEKFIVENKIKSELVNDSLKERIKSKIQEQKIDAYRNKVVVEQAAKYKVSTGITKPQLKLNNINYVHLGTGSKLALAFYNSEDQLNSLIKQAKEQENFKVILIPLVNDQLTARDAIRHICTQDKNPESCISGSIPLSAIRESGLIANLLGITSPAIVYQGIKYPLNLRELPVK